MRAPRGFTMFEMATVMAAVGIAAGICGIGVSTALEHAKRGQKLQATFSEMQQIRAQHLSASAAPTSCLFMKDVGGQLAVEERIDCATAATPTVHDFDGAVALRGGTACVDNLARAINCGDGTVQAGLTFLVDIDHNQGADGVITWGGNGRLSADFKVDAAAGADVQAHLQDAASVVTPHPTVVGQFAGTTTNPQGLLE